MCMDVHRFYFSCFVVLCTRIPLDRSSMHSTPTEKISELLAKKAALEARIKRLKNRESSAERKARNHAMLLLGVVVEKQLKQEPDSAVSVRNWIAQHLQPRDREALISYLFSSCSPSAELPRTDDNP